MIHKPTRTTQPRPGREHDTLPAGPPQRQEPSPQRIDPRPIHEHVRDNTTDRRRADPMPDDA